MFLQVPFLHGPCHVQADPAGLGGVHHLGVQHDDLVVGAGFRWPTARILQLQLRHRYTDLLSRLTVRAQLVQSQLGSVNIDLRVGSSLRELHFVELRGDVGNVRELSQQLVVRGTCGDITIMETFVSARVEMRITSS